MLLKCELFRTHPPLTKYGILTHCTQPATGSWVEKTTCTIPNVCESIVSLRAGGTEDDSDAENSEQENLAEIATGLGNQCSDFFFGDVDVDTANLEFSSLKLFDIDNPGKVGAGLPYWEPYHKKVLFVVVVEHFLKCSSMFQSFYVLSFFC